MDKKLAQFIERKTYLLRNVDLDGYKSLEQILFSRNNALRYNEESTESITESSFTLDGADFKPFSIYEEEFYDISYCWTNLGNAFVPCIIRREEEYSAAKILEELVFNKLLKDLHEQLYKHFVPTYFMTISESCLLNDVIRSFLKNYAIEPLESKDLIVNLKHAKELYAFIKFCHNLTNSNEVITPSKFGFVRLNKKALIPFIKRDEKHYVPLVFFEGNLAEFEEKADMATNIEWCYMKLCFIIEGTREQIFHENMKILPLEELKSGFKNEFVYEEFWPTLPKNFNLITNKNVNNYVPLKWLDEPIVKIYTSTNEKRIIYPSSSSFSFSKFQLTQISSSNSNSYVLNNDILDDGASHSTVFSQWKNSENIKYTWTILGNVFIPIIYRRKDKYCAAQVVEDLVYKNYLVSLNPLLYNDAVPSVKMTAAEADVFNSIIDILLMDYTNKHKLNSMEPLINFTDALNFYEFVKYCYELCTTKVKANLKTCGLVLINKKPLVPYIMRNGKHFVPLVYFEGNLVEIQNQATTLTCNEWNYLKLCYVLQGARKHLYDKHTKVYPLEDIAHNYDQNLKFEEFWPTRTTDFASIAAKKTSKYEPLKWLESPRIQHQ